jgi:hypothetical protein
VFRKASHHLMDRELPDAEREALVQALFADPAVQGVHQLRTRASGPYVHVQAHIDVEPTLTLLQAHDVIEGAEKRLIGPAPAPTSSCTSTARRAEHHRRNTRKSAAGRWRTAPTARYPNRQTRTLTAPRPPSARSTTSLDPFSRQVGWRSGEKRLLCRR